MVILCCLEGELTYQTGDSNSVMLFKKCECNLFYMPKGNACLNPKSDRVNLVNIYIEEEFFFTQIPKDHPLFINQNGFTFGRVFPNNLSIGPHVKHILYEINSCSFKGHLKSLYNKAKVLELLTLLFSYSESLKNPELRASEIEKMIKVKELIEKELNKSHQLNFLAKMAGTNEQYLKKHFKLIFGFTVFGYSLHCKMQKAKEMLLTGDYRIIEVAETIGYKHPTHFTQAFKKFFGYLPRMLKAKSLSLSYLFFKSLSEIAEVFQFYIPSIYYLH